MPHNSTSFPLGDSSTQAASKLQTFQVLKSKREDPNTQTNEALRRSILSSWALLLHFYTLQDEVSFLFTRDTSLKSDGEGCNGEMNPLRAGETPKMLNFHVTQSDSVPNMTWDVIDLEENVDKVLDINSAVTMTDRPSIDFNGPFHGETRVGGHETLPCNVEGLELFLGVHAYPQDFDVKMIFLRPAVSTKYARSICDLFQLTLKAVVTGFGDQTVRDIQKDVLNDKMLCGWNRHIPQHHPSCIHHLVSQTARLLPDREAVHAWDGSFSYQELNRASSRLAATLMSAGVKPGSFVPFAFEKSAWATVAALGILKAGAAFIPLEGTYPSSRIKEIVDQAQVKVCVTSRQYEAVLKNLVDEVVVVSKNSLGNLDTREAGVEPVTRSWDAVFVLFTSGSTGKPKGIVQEHGAICAHAISHGEAMRFRGRRVLQFAAHTFDVAFMDIFTTLMFGGTVCVPSEEERMGNVVGAINSMNVDLAILTPLVAKIIDPSNVPGLRVLAVGGEPWLQQTVDKWASQVLLLQIYGPAEVGICNVIEMQAKRTRPETVGFPSSNCICRLVNPDDPDTLVPPGAVGELVVSGPSITRGYLNDIAKTEQSFWSDPSWAAAGSFGEFRRFFRTQDLLRYNVDRFDGSMDFIGRKDSQIKLRGQRLELGEVEHHISCYPGVSKCMVCRPESGRYNQQLVAIVEVQEDLSSGPNTKSLNLKRTPSLDTESLKSSLSVALPSYMVPTDYLQVDRIPTTPSYKIDRMHIRSWLHEFATRQTNGAEDPNTSSMSIPREQEITLVLSRKVEELHSGREKNLSELYANGTNVNLTEFGIDSVKMMSLSMFIQCHFHTKIPMSLLLDPSLTTSQLARLVSRGAAGRPENESAVDVSLEARKLTHDLLYPGTGSRSVCEHFNSGYRSIPPRPTRNVMLTGATGYLGTEILRQLLARTELHVFAVVRCASKEAGRKRLCSIARTQRWWRNEYDTRLTIWKGDLAKPNIGLAERPLRLIRGKDSADSSMCIDAMIHCGATVHYYQNYSQLKNANVQSTVNMLRQMLGSSLVRRFVFVSGGQKPDEATCDLSQASGYTQTKRVSEEVVKDCASHAAFSEKIVSVVKPGYIIGSATNAFPNSKDFLWKLVASCLHAQAFNSSETGHWAFVAPVDRVASLVAEKLQDRDEPASVAPVLDGMYFNELWSCLQQDFGYQLQGMPAGEWIKRIEKYNRLETDPLFSLLEYFLQENNSLLGSQYAPAGAKHVGLDVLRANVKRLIAVGFLPPARPSRLQT
ncbi:MAG: putative NRPS-like protein biosynthetic cluster [Alyxoria varia]|nr:MAG: putative NRPS-like protein biosynthetic cluster [Alyxoria varia]